MPGGDAKPTLSASYSRRVYDGGAPELDIGSPMNSVDLYASADVKGFHYDANAVFNETWKDGCDDGHNSAKRSPSLIRWRRGFALSGEIWHLRSRSCTATRSGICGRSATPREGIWFRRV
jgi:hypothetical protein